MVTIIRTIIAVLTVVLLLAIVFSIAATAVMDLYQAFTGESWEARVSRLNKEERK